MDSLTVEQPVTEGTSVMGAPATDRFQTCLGTDDYHRFAIYMADGRDLATYCVDDDPLFDEIGSDEFGCSTHCGVLLPALRRCAS
jgi:hypothetical protein